MMAPRDEIITAAALSARLAALNGWHGDAGGISRTYAIGYDDAIRAVAEIGAAAAELEHRPDIDIRWAALTVRLTTHTAGDVVTELDFLTVARVDEIAARHGATTLADRTFAKTEVTFRDCRLQKVTGSDTVLASGRATAK